MAQMGSRNTNSAVDSTVNQQVKLTVTMGTATATQNFTCYEAHSEMQ
jgi:hypothetical protein